MCHGACNHAFCLMSNHYHLLVETPEGNLSQIITRPVRGPRPCGRICDACDSALQRNHVAHQWSIHNVFHNTKRQRSGHLFQWRYKAILVEADEYAKTLSLYIHLNPVGAGMVGTPGDYEWSSYRDHVGVRDAPGWLERELIFASFGTEWG